VRPIGALLLVLCLVLTGCTSNSVSSGIAGDTFVFVSPGGKTEFHYPAAERKSVGNFTGSSVSDEKSNLALTDFPQTVLVLNFWGSWCGPCREEADDLNVAAELTKSDGVQFLGVNVKDQRSAAADFQAAHEVQFPSIFDPSMRTLLSLQGFPTSAIPSTIVLDRQHRVASIFLGAVTAQQLTDAVTAVADENTSATP
jgi:peroxiredoxin